MNNRNGLLAAAGAYILWGLLPIYWKSMAQIPSYEILSHRIIWSMVVTLVLVFVTKRIHLLKACFSSPKTLLIFFTTASLLGGNWLVYIWAVNAGFVVESSLGYFINPLFSVVLAVIFLKERLRLFQWLSILIALGGVFYLTYSYGRIPYIALWLSFTFGFYGLLHKKAALGSLEGLTLETVLLAPLALVALTYIETTQGSQFIRVGATPSLLLMMSGIVTTIPLLLFGWSTKKVDLSTLGILQYLAPTLQFLVGIFIYKEAFPREKMIGFSIVWLALFCYVTEGVVQRVRRRKARLGPLVNT